MLIFKKIDLPAPPQYLIDQALTQVEQQDLVQIPRQAANHRRLGDFMHRTINLGQTTAISRVQMRYFMSDELVAWGERHLPPGHTDFNLAVSTGDSLHGPHIDAHRKYGLNYLISSNAEATTSWWHKPDWDIEYDPSLWPKDRPHHHNYEGLNLLRRETLQPGHWYLLNTHMLHSVENVHGPRISLQADYNTWV